MNSKLLFLTALVSLSVGCVGIGFTVSPAEGRISFDFQARDCITDNLIGRTISAIPIVGDWSMLNWGCGAIWKPPVDESPQ